MIGALISRDSARLTFLYQTQDMTAQEFGLAVRERLHALQSLLDNERLHSRLTDADPLTRQCGLILEGFVRTMRTEGRFFLRFCALAPMQRQALARHWRLDPDDPWRIFRRVCAFFAV